MSKHKSSVKTEMKSLEQRVAPGAIGAALAATQVHSAAQAFPLTNAELRKIANQELVADDVRRIDTEGLAAASVSLASPAEFKFLSSLEGKRKALFDIQTDFQIAEQDNSLSTANG